jgi:hypothetical protein
MADNKHFIQFLNMLGLTVNEMAIGINMSYATARNKVETLNFSTQEYCALSKFTSIPEEELLQIVLNKKSLKDVVVPYALTKEMAFEKMRIDDDFLRMILECSFVGAHQKRRTATQQEINTLKKYIQNYNK